MRLKLFSFLVVGLLYFTNCQFMLAKDIQHDKEVELFWRILFQKYHFGYTLFGDKPLSFDCYYVSNPTSDLYSCNQNYLLRNLWKKWESHYFPTSDSFVFKRLQFNVDTLGLLEEFFLINKPVCLSIIERYWVEFENYFKPLKNPKEVLDTICENGPHIIKNHRLLGLLLGYGDHNTALFQLRENLFELLAQSIYLQNKHDIAKLSHRELNGMLFLRKQSIVKPQISWDDLLNQYKKTSEQLSLSLNALIPYTAITSIPLPPCLTDPYHPETSFLLEHNLRLQERINQIYYDFDFLQIILEKLSSKCLSKY